MVEPTEPPPDGRGPALEWTRNEPRTSFLAAGGVLLYGLTLMTIASRGFSWLTAWGAWVFIGIVVLAFWSGAGAVTPEVGSDWMRVRRRWVDLYDLVRIRGDYFPTMTWTLHDSAGRRLKISDERLHENPDVWPLVRNGLEHFIAAWALGVVATPELSGWRDGWSWSAEVSSGV